jgi:HK97 family phage prohead protease
MTYSAPFDTIGRRESKAFNVDFKSVDVKAGTVEAITSVFGNRDRGGDTMMPGAFADTLSEWKASGDPLPFIWSHDWNDPMAHIGYCSEYEATDTGLWVKAQVDTDRPFAEQVLHLLKSRRVKQFSFGYFTVDAKWTEDPDTGRWTRELWKVDLIETGPTLVGMNPDTELIEAAAAGGLVAPAWAKPLLEMAAKGAAGGTGDSDLTVNLDRLERASALLTRPRNEGMHHE